MSSESDEHDDAALFRQAIGPVKPLPASAPPPARPKPRPRAGMGERDERAALSEFRQGLSDLTTLAAGDTQSFRRDFVPPSVFQRLKRGRFSAQDELDLHGATMPQAESMLRQFLAEAHDHEFGCVRIIHGKGLRDDRGTPVLKNLVDRILRHRADVLAFHSSPSAQGGTGSLLVLLANR